MLRKKKQISCVTVPESSGSRRRIRDRRQTGVKCDIRGQILFGTTIRHRVRDSRENGVREHILFGSRRRVRARRATGVRDRKESGVRRGGRAGRRRKPKGLRPRRGIRG